MIKKFIWPGIALVIGIAALWIVAEQNDKLNRKTEWETKQTKSTASYMNNEMANAIKTIDHMLSNRADIDSWIGRYQGIQSTGIHTPAAARLFDLLCDLKYRRDNGALIESIEIRYLDLCQKTTGFFALHRDARRLSDDDLRELKSYQEEFIGLYAEYDKIR